MTPASAPAYANRHWQIAAEVLELGEALFDAVLDAAAASPTAQEGEPFPEIEMRTAADEFFQAVRALLGLPEDGTAMLSTGSGALLVVAQHFCVHDLDRDGRVLPPLDEPLEPHPPSE